MVSAILKWNLRNKLAKRDTADVRDGKRHFGTGYARWAFQNLLPAEKKYPKECEEARQDSFLRILKFLEEWDCNAGAEEV